MILTNNTKEKWEQKDLKIIRTEFLIHNNKHWYRMITMDLKTKSIKMNSKKVYRIMKKYWLKAEVRKKRRNYHINNLIIDNYTVHKNILNRNFKWKERLKKLWTDITYLNYNWKKCYLSILKDMITWEIISHKISKDLWINFVLETINWVKEDLRWSIIQSDQWIHYKSLSYQILLKNKWVIQSMSRKWQCLDNAPTESFFWHMKDEIDLKNCKNIKEV